MIMLLVQVLVLILVIGIFYYVIESSPLDSTLKWVFKSVLLIVAALCLLWMFGLTGGEPIRVRP